MTVRRGRPGRGVFAQRRGAVRTGRRAAAGSVGGWLADRTVRRRWRRLSLSEWLIVLVAVVVAGAGTVVVVAGLVPGGDVVPAVVGAAVPVPVGPPG